MTSYTPTPLDNFIASAVREAEANPTAVTCHVCGWCGLDDECDDDGPLPCDACGGDGLEEDGIDRCGRAGSIMSEYSAEDQAKDKAWGEAMNAVFCRGETCGTVFECQACGHTGTIHDFHAIAPSETEAGLPICDECVTNPSAASSCLHPFGQLLQLSGRDQ